MNAEEGIEKRQLHSPELSSQKLLTTDSLIGCLNAVDMIVSRQNRYIYCSEQSKKEYEDALQLLLPWQAYMIHTAESLDRPFTQSELREYIECTVILLEACQIDDIAGQKQGDGFNSVRTEKFHSQYGRSHNIEIPLLTNTSSSAFFRNSELEYIFGHADSDLKVQSHEDAREAITNDMTTEDGWKDVFVQDAFESLESYSAFMSSIDVAKASKAHIMLHCKIKLGQDVGIWKVMLSNGEKGSAPSEVAYGGELYTLTPVSKGDMWRAIFESGYVYRYRDSTFKEDIDEAKEDFMRNIRTISEERVRQSIHAHLRTQEQLNNLSPSDFVADLINNKRNDIEVSRLTILRKLSIFQKSTNIQLTNDENSSLESILDRHRFVYTQLFLDPEKPLAYPQIHLTRSGTSANNTAMLIAKSLVCPETGVPRVHMVDGWYDYENAVPTPWEIESTDQANILLVSIEPNVPQMNRNEKEFKRYRDEEIELFITQARHKPEQKFALIADITADPLQHDFMHKLSIPDNVTVIRTASISKHQRGDRTHFFGVLAISGEVVPQEIVDTAKRAVTGELTDEDVYVFPRLTKTELKENYEHLNNLAKTFEVALQKAQRYIPRAKRWVFQKYSYYGFLLPPQSALYYYRNNNDVFDALLQSTPIEKAINSYIYQHPNAVIDKGDSYGLNTTRCARFGIQIPVKRLRNSFKGTVIRFGFGLKTPTNEIREIAETIGDYISR